MAWKCYLEVFGLNDFVYFDFVHLQKYWNYQRLFMQKYLSVIENWTELIESTVLNSLFYRKQKLILE